MEAQGPRSEPGHNSEGISYLTWPDLQDPSDTRLLRILPRKEVLALLEQKPQVRSYLWQKFVASTETHKEDEWLEHPSVNNTIICELTPYSRADAAALGYTTMSYTWGVEQPDQRYLICNSQLVKILKNCEDMLRSLSRMEFHSALWIDAICIDQGNIAERNAQVKRMGETYGSSKQTIIYLTYGFGQQLSRLPCLLYDVEEDIFASAFPDASERREANSDDVVEFGLLSLQPRL